MNPTKIGHAELVTRLRSTASSQDLNRRAATELLIEHDFWLRRESFVRKYVRCEHGSSVVDWWDVDADLNDKVRDLVVASSSELAMLRLAVFLARDPLQLRVVGSGNSGIAAREFAYALGCASGVDL